MNLFVRIVPALVLAQLVCLLLHWRRRRKEGRPKPRLLAALTVLLFLATWPPASWLATLTLEWGYDTEPRPGGDAEAIVVLAGAVLPPREFRPVMVLTRDTYVRCRHAAWLYKSWRELPVLASGGRMDAGPADSTLARAMAEYLEYEGVPRTSIWREERSRSTHENALYCAEILEQKGIRRIVLVTEAYHMPRAERCFRAQGIEVVPAPCDFRTAAFDVKLDSFVPSYLSLAQNERVVHEWIGILWYWVRGRF